MSPCLPIRRSSITISRTRRIGVKLRYISVRYSEAYPASWSRGRVLILVLTKPFSHPVWLRPFSQNTFANPISQAFWVFCRQLAQEIETEGKRTSLRLEDFRWDSNDTCAFFRGKYEPQPVPRPRVYTQPGGYGG